MSGARADVPDPAALRREIEAAGLDPARVPHAGTVDRTPYVRSRLEMRRGVYDKAFKRLRKGLLKSGSLDSTAGYVLLAIAAQATGHKEELEEAMRQARENGADLASLASR